MSLPSNVIFTGTRSGTSVLMPKFILKPKPTKDEPSSKKPRSEPAAMDQSGDTGGEGENKLIESNSNTANGLQSLCQNYDSDESD